MIRLPKRRDSVERLIVNLRRHPDYKDFDECQTISEHKERIRIEKMEHPRRLHHEDWDLEMIEERIEFKRKWDEQTEEQKILANKRIWEGTYQEYVNSEHPEPSSIEIPSKTSDSCYDTEYPGLPETNNITTKQDIKTNNLKEPETTQIQKKRNNRRLAPGKSIELIADDPPNPRNSDKELNNRERHPELTVLVNEELKQKAGSKKEVDSKALKPSQDENNMGQANEKRSDVNAAKTEKETIKDETFSDAHSRKKVSESTKDDTSSESSHSESDDESKEEQTELEANIEQCEDLLNAYEKYLRALSFAPKIPNLILKFCTTHNQILECLNKINLPPSSTPEPLRETFEAASQTTQYTTSNKRTQVNRPLPQDDKFTQTYNKQPQSTEKATNTIQEPPPTFKEIKTKEKANQTSPRHSPTKNKGTHATPSASEMASQTDEQEQQERQTSEKPSADMASQTEENKKQITPETPPAEIANQKKTQSTSKDEEDSKQVQPPPENKGNKGPEHQDHLTDHPHPATSKTRSPLESQNRPKHNVSTANPINQTTKQLAILMEVPDLYDLSSVSDLFKDQFQIPQQNYRVVQKRTGRQPATSNWLLLLPIDLIKFIISQGGLKINDLTFRLRPFTSVQRCRNCQALGHSDKRCPYKTICETCGDQHPQANCSHHLKCINCTSHNAQFRSNFETNHKSSSSSCQVFRQAYTQKRSLLDQLFNPNVIASLQPFSHQVPSYPSLYINDSTFNHPGNSSYKQLFTHQLSSPNNQQRDFTSPINLMPQTSTPYRQPFAGNQSHQTSIYPL